MSDDRSISTSRDIKIALLKQCGIPSARVCDVELDLTGSIAVLRVTVTVPSCVNGLITHELDEYELVRRAPKPGAD